jgi:MFS transporter, PAT family, beta-lactamase induction signal transducer AmpG
LLNLSIAYSAIWQGIAIEAFGYPNTMLIDAIVGLFCLALLPWIRTVRGNQPDGGAPMRARISAAVLGLACIAWLPYRLGQGALGAAAPVFETLFNVVFVASALFLLAGAAVLTQGSRAWARAGGWMALLLFLMYARRWSGGFSGDAAQAVSWLIHLVPVVAGFLLLALATQAWRELRPAPAAADAAPHTSASIK